MKLLASILIKGVIAYAICSIWAIIRMTIFGQTGQMSMIGALILLALSITAADRIVSAIAHKINKD